MSRYCCARCDATGVRLYRVIGGGGPYCNACIPADWPADTILPAVPVYAEMGEFTSPLYFSEGELVGFRRLPERDPNGPGWFDGQWLAILAPPPRTRYLNLKAT